MKTLGSVLDIAGQIIASIFSLGAAAGAVGLAARISTGMAKVSGAFAGMIEKLGLTNMINTMMTGGFKAVGSNAALFAKGLFAALKTCTIREVMPILSFLGLNVALPLAGSYAFVRIVGGAFWGVGQVMNPIIAGMPQGATKNVYNFIYGSFGQGGLKEASNPALSIFGVNIPYGVLMYFGRPLATIIKSLPLVSAFASFFSAGFSSSKAAQIAVQDMVFDEGVKENLVQAVVTPFVGPEWGDFIAECFDETPDGVRNNVNAKATESAASTIKAFIINGTGSTVDNLNALAEALDISPYEVELITGAGGFASAEARAEFADAVIARIPNTSDARADLVKAAMSAMGLRVDLLAGYNPVS
ncbi:MAG: hypothetical protein Q8R48_08330, partial [Candidatus Omnitrophota bacterium]|nr:hypothetical protein [Candidatus Omnitrophota bacterium]